eukprot:CAMPEP_0206493264 /NCGR_PEP_ID=MMETSP0324_2-20121206/46817_1 /ASSEMBLY_ACC=CAM_ASM_000836 /TAXON_ID=2866 /ORGANISM="Crypthecodinium cohnii, Strain Seligo" /LENGTH=48 /DNA_ID= /DNA_START= /DNA_END= /DNA_ORIENTATION=
MTIQNLVEAGVSLRVSPQIEVDSGDAIVRNGLVIKDRQGLQIVLQGTI